MFASGCRVEGGCGPGVADLRADPWLFYMPISEHNRQKCKWKV